MSIRQDIIKYFPTFKPSSKYLSLNIYEFIKNIRHKFWSGSRFIIDHPDTGLDIFVIKLSPFKCRGYLLYITSNPGDAPAYQCVSNFDDIIDKIRMICTYIKLVDGLKVPSRQDLYDITNTISPYEDKSDTRECN